MGPLVRALRFILPYWPAAAGGLASTVLVAAANMLAPQLIRAAIDNGILVGNLAGVFAATAALPGVALVRGLFNFLERYLAERAAQGAAYDIRNLIYGKLQTLSFSFHDRSQTGQMMTRVTSDVEMVRMFLGNGFLQLVSAVLSIVGVAVVLLLMNWRLALMTLPMLPLIFLVFGTVMRYAQPLFTQVQERLSALNTILQENLAGVRVVKAFVREPYEAGRYATANDELLEKNVQVVRTFAIAFPSTFFVANLATVAVLWFGGWQVIGGELTLGELVAFNTYLGFLTFPAFMLGMISAMMARAGASARRVFEVADAESEVRDRPDALPLPRAEGRVVFDNVSFRYVGSDRNVLDGVSFAAEPGQTVAIVGSTGSGKSTVINLIPRFYDVTGGRVLVDDHDVREVSLSSLRRQIGIVLQDTILFSGTIRENIAYGAPDASQAEIERAARLAQAHEFILAQPSGYDTKIGEGGVGLSGGQMQRIAIARALLLDPRVLIFDESTSSVDAETEYRIQKALDELMGGRTAFVIAQRISTVRNADLILVLDNARIVASGTHDQLLATSPLYGDIVASQLHDDAPDLTGPAPEDEPLAREVGQ